MHGKDHTAECRVGGTCCRGVPWQVLYRCGMRGPGACAGLGHARAWGMRGP
jgi:hypothetical protein